MPSGVYPEDHKHVKARGLSRNKFDTKGEPRKPRKSRSKIADAKQAIGLQATDNPQQVLQERRGLVRYALDNYDFGMTGGSRAHLEMMVDNQNLLMSDEGKSVSDSFRDDYAQHMNQDVTPTPIPKKTPKSKKQIVVMGDDYDHADHPPDVTPNTIFHKVNKTAINTANAFPLYDIDNPYSNLTAKDLSPTLLTKGKVRQRAERSDKGKAKERKLSPYQQGMEALKAKVTKRGEGLQAVKGIETESSWAMDGYDESTADDFLQAGEERRGGGSMREGTWDDRYRSDPTEGLRSIKNQDSHHDPVPFAQRMSLRHNYKGRLLGNYQETGGDGDDRGYGTSEYEIMGQGGITYDDLPYGERGGISSGDEQELQHHLVDKYIHDIAFEGLVDSNSKTILDNLKSGKKFDLGFDALFNPYLIGKDMGKAPAKPSGVRIGDEVSKGMTPSILPKHPVVATNEVFQPKKVYVGEKDSLGNVKKRKGLEMGYDIYGEKKPEHDVNFELHKGKSVYTEEEGMRRGGKIGAEKFRVVGSTKYLVIHGDNKKELPTASGALPVPGWSKQNVIYDDGSKAFFRKHLKKQGYHMMKKGSAFA